MRLAALAALFILASAARAADLDVKALWTEKNCVKCHAADGTGHTELGKKNHAPNFNRRRWQERHSDEEIKKAIIEGVKEEGKVLMPSFRSKLNDEQIEALVAYVRHFGGKGSAKAREKEVEKEVKKEAEKPAEKSAEEPTE